MITHALRAGSFAAAIALPLLATSGCQLSDETGTSESERFASTVEVNVGYASPAGKDAALDAAAAVTREFEHIDVVTIRAAEQAIEGLRKRPDVRYVEENGTMYALQTTPYGIEITDADVAIDDGNTGAGADIAIIDTGIDAQHETLQENLGEGHAVSGYECDAGGGGCMFGGGNDISTCHAEWDDDNDHGTHCAGSAAAADNGVGVLGVAPEATLHAVKVLDNCGSGSYDSIAAGIEWAASQGHDVLSMSLGGDSSSSAVDDAIAYAVEQNAVLVAAAGNDGPCTDCVGYPARHPDVIAVSATDENDDLADFSSTGPEVEIAAPGDGVYSSVPRDDYTTLSGTSMSTPHVAGAAASVIASGTTDRQNVRQALKDGAEDVGLASNEQGAGRLNVANAAGSDGGGGGDDGGSAPSVAWANPLGGDTVSGTVSVQIDASDEEDADDSLEVTYNIDAGSSRTTTYNTDTGYYEDSWDTTGVADGDHALEANVSDSDGNTSSASISVTVDNGGDDGGDTAPAVDVHDVYNNKPKNPHAEIRVDWAVSDEDGDLASVTSELYDADGNLIDDAATSVSGGSADGLHGWDIKHGQGATYEVVTTVTDQNGNETTVSEFLDT